MKVLVTGGSGTIGLAISQTLISEGHRVLCYDLKPSNLENPLYSHINGDVKDVSSLSEAGADCDVGIHLAVSTNHTSDVQMISENSSGAFSFFECASRNGFSTSILVSSAPVHLPRSPFDLSIEHLPDNADSYDLSKNLQELIAYFFKVKGLQVCCLRLGHVVFGEIAQNLDTDEPLSDLAYCRGGWLALEDIGPICTAILSTPELGSDFLFNAVGSVSARERFDVYNCERTFGTPLTYDFAEYEVDDT